MAERRAPNKYYPPDWDPSKGSLNKFMKSHPLRDRARKIDQGILVVRFAMPYNVWCSGCNNHIGMGVRYNAEKSKIGSYYDSPIYQLKMKCRLCDNYIVINTDPSKFDYLIASGARRQVIQIEDNKESKDERNQIHQSAIERADEARRRLSNSMYHLEKKIETEMNIDNGQPNLRDIIQWRARFSDDFSVNQIARAQYRRKRKIIDEAKAKDQVLLRKTSLRISLAKSSPSDAARAKSIIRRAQSEQYMHAESTKKNDILKAARFIPRVSSSSKATSKDKF